jgi:hypothetical protein
MLLITNSYGQHTPYGSLIQNRNQEIESDNMTFCVTVAQLNLSNSAPLAPIIPGVSEAVFLGIICDLSTTIADAWDENEKKQRNCIYRGYFSSSGSPDSSSDRLNFLKR